MKYHMLYVKSRKNYEVRRQKYFITLLCAKVKHTAKSCFAACHKKNTRQSISYHTAKYLCLPCARELAHGKL